MMITQNYRFGEKDVLDLSLSLTIRIRTEGGQSADPKVHEGLPRTEEEETSMGTLLLHNGRVEFYLLCVAALVVAFLWDYLRHPTATDNSRTPADPAPVPGSRNWRP
jgi:hypothetical protein